MRQEVLFIFLAAHVVIPRETGHSQLVSLLRIKVEIVQHGLSVRVDESILLDGTDGAVAGVMTVVVGFTMPVLAIVISLVYA